LGFGEGCNLGAENSLGEFLYFVNSDCWFEKDCIKTLHEAALASEPSCAIFSALEYNFEGNIPTIGSHSRGSSGFDLFGCQVKNDSSLDLFTVGTFFFIKRSAFYSVGEFDKKYFVYGEEQDLSWRIILAGLKIKLVEKAIIHHKATTSTSAESITTEFRRFYANRNQLLMILVNSSSVLSLMTLSYTLLIAVEAIAGVILSKKLSFFYTSVVKPWGSCYQLRGYIRQRRQFVKKIRVRNDWWLIANYFKFGFGHWDDIKRFLKFKIEIK
jgi:GT2 family glycosyltransferase